ncbi:MAG: helix-turn-helix domain-containing protein [Desulfosporosinus sp.]|nr:helix-turn-helix domain-containing protein [Desulfosporosinus sp.]MDA8223644.1 helix-turn-helix domain-containing protein [Desulfitobacterium hafniense]
MNKVVHQLRTAREAKGMELKEVEEITKIRTKYLQALEDGDYGVLPGGVYTVGFLRSYARFLDLDADNLVNTFRMEATAAKLETTFDNTLQETNRPYRDQSLLMRISQFYREAGDIFKFLKTSRMEQSKR